MVALLNPTTSQAEVNPEPAYRLLLVGISDEMTKQLEELAGGRCFEAVALDPEEVKRFSWMNSAKRCPTRVVVRLPETEGVEEELIRLCGALHLSLSPLRLVVVLKKMRVQTILNLLRRGVDGVVLDTAPAAEVLEELESAKPAMGEFVPDPSLALDSLLRVAEDLHLSEVPESGIKKLLMRFVGELNVDRASIALLDDKGGMRLAAIVGPMPGMREGDEITFDKTSISGWVVDNRKARLIRGDVQVTRRQTGNVRSAICAPLIARNELLGVVNFTCLGENRSLDHNDLVTAELFSTLLALAISNQRLNGKMMESEKLMAIGSTISVISHCLRNLLQVLSGSMSLMERALEAQNLQMACSNFRLLKSGVSRVENLVLDLLDVTKKRTPDLRPVDSNELAERMRSSFEHWFQVQRRQLEIVVEASDRLMLDEYRLERALLNLMSNAIDATRPDGKVVITVTEHAEEVSFSVEDDGPGVPAEKLDRIFELFFSTKGSRGTGLGLAMVKKFCDENGGRAEASTSSALGGLRVTMTLPAVVENKVVSIGKES
jgi:signal transduction histidine kinase